MACNSHLAIEYVTQFLLEIQSRPLTLCAARKAPVMLTLQGAKLCPGQPWYLLAFWSQL